MLPDQACFVFSVTSAPSSSFSISADLYIPILSELLRRTTTMSPRTNVPQTPARPQSLSEHHDRPITQVQSDTASEIRNIQKLLEQGYTDG